MENFYLATKRTFGKVYVFAAFFMLANSLFPLFLRAQAPTISYASPQVYGIGQANIYLAPSGGGVAAPGYNSTYTNYTSSIGGPSGVAIDAAGNLYVPDAYTYNVYKIPAGGGTPIVLTTRTGVMGGVAVDGAGNVYVVEPRANNVFEILAANGSVVSIGSGFSLPEGIAVDAAGNVYIADTGNKVVKEIPAGGGAVVTLATGFGFPFGVAVDATGNVLVSDYQNHSVKEIPAGGGAVVTLTSNLNYPKGITVDAAGDIFVADYGDDSHIKEIPAGSGTVVTLGTNLKAFDGVAIDGAGNLYASDSFDGKIGKLAPNGGYYLNKPLPASLSFNDTTGVVSGAATAISAAADYNITAYNSTGSAAATLNLSIIQPPAISYKGPQTYALNTAISPLTPVSQRVASPGLSGNITAVTAAYSYASGVALDAAGDIFVAENYSGLIVHAADGSSENQYPIQDAVAVVADASGNIYVADQGTNQIFEIPAGGDPGNPNVYASGFSHISNIAIDGSGKVYVVDLDEYGNAAVFTVSNGAEQAYEAAEFNNPTGIAADAFGNLYVADQGSGRIFKLSSDGTVLGVLGTFSNPAGLAVDLGGNVYVSNLGDNSVYLIPPGGSPLVLASGFNSPEGMAVDGAGNCYIADFNNGLVDKIVPVGGYYINALLPAGLSFSPSTGTISGTPTAASPAKNYTITAYNVAGSAAAAVSIAVALPNNALLAKLSTNSGVVLTPVTGPDYKDYAITLPSGTASIIVTPTAQDAAATIKVNGQTVTSGSPSSAIPLALGVTTNINTVVTAQDGTTTKTYGIAVTRTSNNAVLAKLTTNTGIALTQVSGPDYKDFTLTVPAKQTSIVITPTTQDSTATVTVNGTTVKSGTGSPAIPLPAGTTTINTVVTAQDGITTKTYSIAVTRTAAANASLTNLVTNDGAISPAFSTGTTSYTLSVANTVTSITLTPTAADAASTIKINGTVVASGSASGAIMLAAGTNTINTVVTAQDGSTTQTYTLTVTRAPSTDALLSSIKTTPTETLTGVTPTGTSYKNYVTSVPNTQISIQITAIPQDATATIKINGTTVASGALSPAISLGAGTTTINTVVTAQDGATTKTYTITVTRQSNNALLTNIRTTPTETLTSVTPAGGSYRSYTATVPSSQASIQVTATAQDNGASITINGTAVASGTASPAITLATGANVINTVVTSSDGTTSKTYTITVNKPSNNALLTKIATNSGVALTTVTGPDYKDYTISVPNATSSITVTPTAQDATATVKVNGITVASGTPSVAMPLQVGSNVINTVVTAQDGVTTKTYGITVIRAAMMALYVPNDSVAIDGLAVHPGITPNGDGINDIFTIDGINSYPDNKVTIMSRSGAVIFEAKGYDNQTKFFDGHSSKNGALQLAGTYFYSLEYEVNGKRKVKTGFVVLKY